MCMHASVMGRVWKGTVCVKGYVAYTPTCCACWALARMSISRHATSMMCTSCCPVGAQYAGLSVNPARDLGPRIAHAFLPIPNKVRGADCRGPAMIRVSGAWAVQADVSAVTGSPLAAAILALKLRTSRTGHRDA